MQIPQNDQAVLLIKKYDNHANQKIDQNKENNSQNISQT